MRVYIEAEKGLEKAMEQAVKEFVDQSLASPEEERLIGNAMRRALQVVLRYQQERPSTKR